jgi:hypothetical protein
MADVSGGHAAADHPHCEASRNVGIEVAPHRAHEPRDLVHHHAREAHEAAVADGTSPPSPVSWGKGGRRANKGKGKSAASTNARAFFGAMRMQGPEGAADTVVRRALSSAAS